jgi:hypothetical protein
MGKIENVMLWNPYYLNELREPVLHLYHIPT